MSRDSNFDAIDRYTDAAAHHAREADRALSPARGSTTEWQHREAQAHAQTSLAFSALAANLITLNEPVA